jgi:hypothetical protein
MIKKHLQLENEFVIFQEEYNKIRNKLDKSAIKLRNSFYKEIGDELVKIGFVEDIKDSSGSNLYYRYHINQDVHIEVLLDYGREFTIRILEKYTDANSSKYITYIKRQKSDDFIEFRSDEIIFYWFGNDSRNNIDPDVYNEQYENFFSIIKEAIKGKKYKK